MYFTPVFLNTTYLGHHLFPALFERSPLAAPNPSTGVSFLRPGMLCMGVAGGRVWSCTVSMALQYLAALICIAATLDTVQVVLLTRVPSYHCMSASTLAPGLAPFATRARTPSIAHALLVPLATHPAAGQLHPHYTAARPLASYTTPPVFFTRDLCCLPGVIYIPMPALLPHMMRTCRGVPHPDGSIRLAQRAAG
jgi:hypothetical protein